MSDNRDVEKIKQRAFRITEALYRTTDFFHDHEPLKWLLRSEGLEILNMASGLDFGQVKDVSRLDDLVRALLLKLELAASSAFTSRANFEVLKREYVALLNDTVSGVNSQTLLLDLPAKRATDSVSDKITDTVTDNVRKETILSALKERGSASVGELAEIFGGSISEKTVQRELSDLVASGEVKQEGEKRWRRYFV